MNQFIPWFIEGLNLIILLVIAFYIKPLGKITKLLEQHDERLIKIEVTHQLRGCNRPLRMEQE